MKVKLRDLYDMEPILTKISKTTMPGYVALKYARFLRTIKEEIELSQSVRQELIVRYAEKDSEGKIVFTEDNGIKINSDQIEEANKDFDGFFNTEYDLPDVSIDDSLQYISLTPAEMQLIEVLFKNE